jgi:hypothetical protein
MNTSAAITQSTPNVFHTCRGCKRFLGVQRGPRVYLWSHQVVQGAVVFRCRCKTVTSIDPVSARVASHLAASHSYVSHVAREPRHV